MIFKSVDGTSYTLRDWINNEEFSLMAEAQMIMLQTTGKICNWDELRMKNINNIDKDGNPTKDKAELTRTIIENGTVKHYAELKSKAAQTIIIKPIVEDYKLLPRDITSEAEAHIERLFIEAQPKQIESKPSKK